MYSFYLCKMKFTKHRTELNVSQTLNSYPKFTIVKIKLKPHFNLRATNSFQLAKCRKLANIYFVDEIQDQPSLNSPRAHKFPSNTKDEYLCGKFNETENPTAQNCKWLIKNNWYAQNG